MCGISGVVSFKRNNFNVLESVKSMTDSLVHRGPDDWGIYTNISNENNNQHIRFNSSSLPPFALGHRRLSIIDLSQAGHQPMVDEENELIIVFNGEIYNYVELRAKLKGQYSFKTNSDTEVLLASYLLKGKDMLLDLDGMFSFLILDIKQRKVFAARDQTGIKPFYYFFNNNSFWFASEPKVILNGLSSTGTPDINLLSEFLILGVSDHDERTFYKNINQLEPSHYLEVTLETGALNIQQYWTPPSIELNQNFEASVRRYKSIFETVVSRQLRSDVTVGSSLSGGIDSSAIVATSGKILGKNAKNYKTLTFSFPGFINDESEMAKKVANRAGLPWISIEPSLNTLQNDLEKMIEKMAEPFSTLSMFAQYKVMEEAKRNGITVMLDGQGGDEVYLGYPRVVQRVIFHYLRNGRLSDSINELRKLNKNLSLSYKNMILGNAYFNSKKIAYTRKKAIFSRYLKPDLENAVRSEVVEDMYAPKNIYAKQNDELLKYLLPRLLRYADRNSMAFGIEQRVPHLSKLILENNLALPIEHRVKNGWSKYMVRKSMNGLVPDEILWSKVKRGFDIPQTFWVDKLSNYLSERISSSDKANTLFKKELVLKDLKTSSKQGSPYLWRTISSILWMEQL